LKSGLMLAPWKVGEIRSLMFVSVAKCRATKMAEKAAIANAMARTGHLARALNQTIPTRMRFNIASTRR